MRAGAGEAHSTDPVFLGKRAEDLSWTIEQQLVPVFKQRGIVIPIRSCSLMFALRGRPPASAADLAKALDQSHQLVLQKTPALLSKRLIRKRDDPNDRRRRVFQLTAAGERQLGLVEDLLALLRAVYVQLDEELGLELFQLLGRAREALEERDLATRLRSLDRQPTRGR